MDNKKKGKSRLRLYWFLNADAISVMILAVLIWSFHLSSYIAVSIVVPSGLVCLAVIHIYHCRFYARMGWDKEHIPWKSIKIFWSLMFIILILLDLLLSEIGILE
jgi:hypothetical protein